jgi:hypothetical protein
MDRGTAAVAKMKINVKVRRDQELATALLISTLALLGNAST